MSGKENRERFKHLVDNFSSIMMAAMMEVMGDTMGKVMDSIAGAFGGGGDVEAGIRGQVSKDFLDQIEEMRKDMRSQSEADAVLEKIPDDQIASVLAIVDRESFPLPDFAGPLAPEAFAGYLHLARSEDEAFGRMLQGVGSELEKIRPEE